MQAKWARGEPGARPPSGGCEAQGRDKGHEGGGQDGGSAHHDRGHELLVKAALSCQQVVVSLMKLCTSYRVYSGKRAGCVRMARAVWDPHGRVV
eukprot:m.51018 g.51018  ORF g.51018 m.51018 type:complete len:94 (-) comp7279_c0_seq1:98-379(-)